MASFDLFALRNVFEEHSIMMCFSGPFSHSVIEELGVAIKKYLLSEDAPKDRLADVFAVFVEQAQNLKNYTERSDFDGSTEANYRSGTLAIAREDERYVVSSGNLVRSEEAALITKELESIIDLDKGELKELYKRRLRMPTEEGRGAGLGFIDMARKAAEPIRFSIRELTDGSAFFNISVVI